MTAASGVRVDVSHILVRICHQEGGSCFRVSRQALLLLRVACELHSSTRREEGRGECGSFCSLFIVWAGNAVVDCRGPASLPKTPHCRRHTRRTCRGGPRWPLVSSLRSRPTTSWCLLCLRALASRRCIDSKLVVVCAHSVHEDSTGAFCDALQCASTSRTSAACKTRLPTARGALSRVVSS